MCGNSPEPTSWTARCGGAIPAGTRSSGWERPDALAGAPADAVYGGDYALRLWLEPQPIGHVLAVTGKPRAAMGWLSAALP